MPAQALNLAFGEGRFNLVSLNVTPSSPTPSDLFGSLQGLRLVLDSHGQVYAPEEGVANLVELEARESYRLYTTDAGQLQVEGVPLRPPVEYTVPADRWSWVSYPLLQPVDVTAALADIASVLEIVRDDSGQVWIPGMPAQQTLHNLQPGRGYELLTTEEVSFSFREGGIALAAKGEEGGRGLMATPDAPVPTGLPWNLFVALDHELLHEGAQTVEVLDGDRVVGKSFVDGATRIAPVVAWEGIPAFQVPGFRPGERIYVRVLDGQGGELNARRIEEDPVRFGEGGWASLELEFVPLPEEYAIERCYPNPFNPSLTVVVALPEAGELSVAVYNLMGQRVAELASGAVEAGRHRLHFDGGGMASGVYFVRARVPGRLHEVRKVVLLK
jgi:hypothetical protein